VNVCDKQHIAAQARADYLVRPGAVLALTRIALQLLPRRPVSSMLVLFLCLSHTVMLGVLRGPGLPSSRRTVRGMYRKYAASNSIDRCVTHLYKYKCVQVCHTAEASCKPKD
jgi:hypothetical protein